MKLKNTISILAIATAISLTSSAYAESYYCTANRILPAISKVATSSDAGKTVSKKKKTTRKASTAAATSEYNELFANRYFSGATYNDYGAPMVDIELKFGEKNTFKMNLDAEGAVGTTSGTFTVRCLAEDLYRVTLKFTAGELRGKTMKFEGSEYTLKNQDGGILTELSRW